MILNVIDQFTKWIECYPLPAQDAERCAKSLVDEFFARFGCPIEIFSDQGKNVMSNLFNELCNLLQITKKRTSPYHPMSNGQTERMNRSILQAVRCLTEKRVTDWDLYLSQIGGAIRSTVNRSTGFTPNKLMLGREVFKPVDLIYGLAKQNQKTEQVSDFVKRVEQQMHFTA